jgi:hypothetical protein
VQDHGPVTELHQRLREGKGLDNQQLAIVKPRQGASPFHEQ